MPHLGGLRINEPLCKDRIICAWQQCFACLPDHKLYLVLTQEITCRQGVLHSQADSRPNPLGHRISQTAQEQAKPKVGQHRQIC